MDFLSSWQLTLSLVMKMITREFCEQIPIISKKTFFASPSSFARAPRLQRLCLTWPLVLSPLQAAVISLPISQNQAAAAAAAVAVVVVQRRTPFVTQLTDVPVKSCTAASPADGI